MITLLLIASMSRCTSPTVCPSDEELLSAVRNRDGAIIQEVANQAETEDPGSIVLIHGERIRRISDVLCGDEMPSDRPGEPRSVICKFTVRYWSNDAYTVARMVQQAGGWEIDDALSVSRKRR